jgi:hypothetical protein
MRRASAHPLPHRAHVPPGLALAGPVLVSRGPLRTPLVLAHLRAAFTMALALILWVLVVHASPLRISVSISIAGTESETEARSTRVYRKKGSVIYLAAFQPMFQSTRGHARFYCGLDTRYVGLSAATPLLPPFSGLQVLYLSRNAEGDLPGRPRSDSATRLRRLAGVLPSGEPRVREYTAAAHLAVDKKRNSGGGLAANLRSGIHSSHLLSRKRRRENTPT